MIRVIAFALAVVLVGPASSASADHPSGRVRASEPVVTAYAMSGLKGRVVRRDAHAFDILGVSGISVKPDGSGVTSPDAGVRRLRRQADAQGVRAELLVTNWTARLGDFDPALATALLSDPDNRHAAAVKLARIARRGGWDGITLDLEAMRKRDRHGLVALARELRDLLPAHRELSMDIGARGSIKSYRRSGFALGKLSRIVDRIVLMTYDQHGPSWSGPGPIGALPWQTKTLAVLLTKVPGGMVDLGVAGYGYTWPKVKTGHTISPRRARAKVRADGATAVWHARAGEWRAKLSNGTVIWWSDARSYQLRVDLARTSGVHGLAMWALGTADPLP